LATGKDYAKIAQAAITTPSKDRPPRWCIYSRNKKGKTRFCLSAPSSLVIDPENGTDEYEKFAAATGSKVWHINQWEDVDDVWGYLRTGGYKNHKWVSFDGGSRMYRMALRFVKHKQMERDLDVRPDQIEKRDYGRANDMLEQMLHNLNTLPIGVIYTTQERFITLDEETSDDTDVETTNVNYVVDLPKGARASLLSIVDVIGRLYVVRTDVKYRDNEGKVRTKENVQQRRLWLEPHVSYDTGYRSEFVLPPYLRNPTVPRLAQLIKEGPKKNGD
jgi:AAA domain